MTSKGAPKNKPPAISVSGKSMTAKLTKDELKGHQETQAALTHAGAWSSEPASPTEPSAVEQVMNINRRLVAQIETLRLKVDVDARQHEKAKNSLLNDNTVRIKTRELEIKNLRSDLRNREEKVKNLTTENQMKSSEISRLQQEIDELKDDVKVSKEYADEIQYQLEMLQSAKVSLENGSAYTKDNEIRSLQQEVDNLKNHLLTLERELSKAKEKIAQQGGKLRLVEVDRGNVQTKFKEELAKVTQTMRNEIERMRDVMKQQWEEMRELREQNEDMRSDIREIRELLVAEQLETNQSRVYGHAHSPFNLHPLTPTLPNLNKDTRRIVHKRKS